MSTTPELQLAEMTKKYRCSITHQIMMEPVFTADGHTYEREAIETWLKTNNTSPKTGKTLDNKKLTPDWDKKSDITKFLEQHPELYEKDDEVYLPQAWSENLLEALNSFRMSSFPSNSLLSKNLEASNKEFKEKTIKEIQDCLNKDPRLLTLKLTGDYTAFHLACEQCSEEVIELLLKHLMKRKQWDKILKPQDFESSYLNLLLQTALEKKESEKVSILLKLGAKKTNIGQKGAEALALTLKNNSDLKSLDLLAFSSSSSSSSSSSKSTNSKSTNSSEVKVKQDEVNTFLNLVMEGKQDKAEAMLKKTPDLALVSGDGKDPSGRVFKSITGFQYAAWALDSQMWTMIANISQTNRLRNKPMGFRQVLG